MAKYKGAEPNSDNEEAELAAIRYSIEKGQNHIDCAELYGAFHTIDENVMAVNVQLSENEILTLNNIDETKQ